KVTPAAEGQKTLTCSTTCTLTDNRNPTYIWYKNRQPVKEDSSPMYSISSEDADSYSCAVKGREDGPKNTSLSDSPSGEIVEGSSVTLTCSSDANPPVQSYTWWYKKNGGHNQSISNHNTGSHHVFNQIQSSDSGEYYCEAQNEMGTDSTAQCLNEKVAKQLELNEVVLKYRISKCVFAENKSGPLNSSSVSVDV
uniref:Ig-like domain-containing protein n=1 Tax=Salmo trutta TaxID=8032 RepID=A0A674A572_SALTR